MQVTQGLKQLLDPSRCTRSRRSQGGEDGTPASPRAEADTGDMPLAVDVAEDAFAFTFTADVPGVQRSAVKVTPSVAAVPSLVLDSGSRGLLGSPAIQRRCRAAHGNKVHKRQPNPIKTPGRVLDVVKIQLTA